MSFRSVVKKAIPKGVFPAIEPYGHLGEAVLLNSINGFPTRGLKVIGVTGTNGKTTTCFMIHRMLHEAGYKVGLLSTVANGIGMDIKPQMHHMTTVSVPLLLRRLKAMKEADVDWVVLETTSYALAQHRVWGIPYSIAVLTNITHEHLSYHRTFERYRDAKLKLFKLANKNKNGLRLGIINAEDPSADLFAQHIARPVRYGINKGDVRATDIKLMPNGLSYTAELEGIDGSEAYHIRCQIPGTFNVYNSLAAVAVGRALGLTKKQIEQGIAALEGVEGRMNRIDEGQNFTVIVDYAHTPDSFEKLFNDIGSMAKGRIITVFGSLGGGDREKRPQQGKIAGAAADIVVICEEDDRTEDGAAIMNQIAAGALEAGKVIDENLFLVHDRAKAIQFALKQASRGDLVLLLGKGHEKTIEHADGEHPWDEIGTARRLLKTLHKK
jgi:UDP-N-acetylmuramoyl-L-alanyl-D-glutamate--2,6-diaminopimelate ligase